MGWDNSCESIYLSYKRNMLLLHKQLFLETSFWVYNADSKNTGICSGLFHITFLYLNFPERGFPLNFFPSLWKEGLFILPIHIARTPKDLLIF